MNVSALSSKIQKELQAHIYQQLFELESYLIPNTQVSVTVQEYRDPSEIKKSLETAINKSSSSGIEVLDAKDSKSLKPSKNKKLTQKVKKIKLPKDIHSEKIHFLVKLQILTANGPFDSEAMHEDIFKAVTDAKDILLYQLQFIREATEDNKAREKYIRDLQGSKLTIH